MSLKSKIEAVIYASEEPVTLAQIVVLLSEEAQAELDALAARQSALPLDVAAEPAVRAEAASAETVTADVLEEGSAPLDKFSAPETEIESGEDAPQSEQAQPTEAETDEPPAGVPTISPEAEKRLTRERDRAVREYLRSIIDSLIREYADSDRGLEIREVAGGFRFGTKPEYHDAVRGFVKNLKPALKLSLQALETLAVVAYKQPVTAAEISEIRGVDSAGVLGGLLTRKLIQTAGRKQVIGRPMLYKTTKEFLVRFGLRDIQELPSMEEFERMAGELTEQEDLPMEDTENIIERANARGDAEHIHEANSAGASPAEEAGPAVEQDDQPGDSSEPAAGPDEAQGESSARSEAEPPTAATSQDQA